MRKHAPLSTDRLALAFSFLGKPPARKTCFCLRRRRMDVAAHMARPARPASRSTEREGGNTQPRYFHTDHSHHSCGELIRMKVCYYQTQTVSRHGTPWAISGDSRHLPGVNTFRYSILTVLVWAAAPGHALRRIRDLPENLPGKAAAGAKTQSEIWAEARALRARGSRASCWSRRWLWSWHIFRVPAVANCTGGRRSRRS